MKRMKCTHCRTLLSGAKESDRCIMCGGALTVLTRPVPVERKDMFHRDGEMHSRIINPSGYGYLPMNWDNSGGKVRRVRLIGY